MINSDEVTGEVIKDHNSNWPQIIDHQHRILKLDSHDPKARQYFLHWKPFKACVRYFLWNFYFSPNNSPLKTTKDVFYFI